ncbi:MAG: ion transporter [Planctomycetota bacterium]
MNQTTSLRERLYVIIFEADTPAGKAFDVALLVAIVGSVLAVVLESVPGIAERYGALLRVLEWTFTVLFTAEYLLRVMCVGRPGRYVFSFFGLVDLLAVMPTYLSLFLPGSQSLAVVRVMRLVRVFRVLKLARFLGEATHLGASLRSSVPKITVFLVVVVSLVVVVGALLHFIEGAEHGFTSIPRGIYWAIVTITTVGYGDVSPQTPLGQIIASVLMICGYAIIAVPTGIVAAEIAHHPKPNPTTRVCRECLCEGHEATAGYCKACGAALRPRREPR